MMEASISPLVLTKIRVPAMRLRMLSRARLASLLTPETDARLILVCAPAGYGKTTLLTEWAHSLMENGIDVAWYALDTGDDDPVPFRSYLIASIIQALGPIPELIQIAQLLRSSPEIDLQQIMPAVINAIVLSGKKCLLILDDYQLIASPAIHSSLAYLLEHLPENLRLVIGSRSDPPLPLARLRAKGQMLEVRTADLRFKADESARFLKEIMQLELSAQGVSVLDERTEGWVTGLQLVALSLSGLADKESAIASFTGSHRYLVEYLMEEVLKRQPDEVQSFLLCTSILERMCPPLCDAIQNKLHHSETILKQLEQANLFVVPLDDLGYWYRYHHLFRDFLQARLNRNFPNEINHLHRTACEWLAANGFLREAAGHAFRTHDWEYAAAFVEQNNFTLIVHSDISTLYEWCSMFPEEVMQKHPMLCVIQGLALAYRCRRQNHARVEARLKQIDRIVDAMEDSPFARGIIDFAAVVRTFFSFVPDPHPDTQKVFSYAQRILDHYPEEDAGQFSGLLLNGYAFMALHDAQAADNVFEKAKQMALRKHLYFGVVESTFHQASLANSQGQLRRVIELCYLGQAEISAVLNHPEQELPAVGSLDIALGCALMEQNFLDDAEQHLLRGYELMGGGMNPYYMLAANSALFRLYQIRGRYEEALKYLDRLDITWPDVRFYTQGLRVMHCLRLHPDDPEARHIAEKWSNDFYREASLTNGSLPGLGPLGAAEVYYLASLEWVRVRIATCQGESARSYLKGQLNLASRYALKHREIELSLLEACMNQAKGDLEMAMVNIKHALELAQPEGYIRIFDRDAGVYSLLVKAAQQDIWKEYIERILASIGKEETSTQSTVNLPADTCGLPYGAKLSGREMEILRLMAQGAPNQAIADQLVITIGTVKSHINHILGKLESHNRTEAVARARDLGIL